MNKDASDAGNRPAVEPPPPSSISEPVETQQPFESRLPESNFRCAGCGSRLEFSPSSATLKCNHCGARQVIPQSESQVEELDFREQLAAQLETGSIAELQNEVKCANCGAVLLLESKTVTDDCPYCGGAVNNQPREAQAMIAPKSLLPFKVEPGEARKAFQRWIRSLWFAPSDLVRSANAGQLIGLYLPYWTYDSMTITFYKGQRGDDYWETETYWDTNEKGEREQKTRQVRKTRWHYVAGRVDHWFDDLLIVASRSLPEANVRELGPWDLENLVPFQPSYLSGFRTERYQVDLEEGFDVARDIMDDEIRSLCRQDIGGDHQRLSSVKTQHLNVTFKHVLLPVWHSVYRFRGKPFHIVVNARTLKVTGQRPISWWKVVGLVAGVAATIGTIAAAVAYFQG